MGWIDPAIKDAIQLAVLALIPLVGGLLAAYVRYLTRHIDSLNGTLDRRLGKIESNQRRILGHVSGKAPTITPDPPDASPG